MARGTSGAALDRWYRAHGRHDLPWRLTRDRWTVLVSEVMLHQTQVARVLTAWPEFVAQFPTARALADAGPGAAIAAWGRLGYPRRARALYETATIVAHDGWPDDLTSLPGVGPYTAGALAALTDDVDVPAVDVNIRRVCQRLVGHALTPSAAEDAMQSIAAPLLGRDRLLALMDLGALVCTARSPRCDDCPLRPHCATRGPLAGEGPRRPAAYNGSFRQRRGGVLAALRVGRTRVADLDLEALESLVADGLAERRGAWATLPGVSATPSSSA